MPKPNVLIQIDSDLHTSTFDSMVAIDSGIDHLIAQPDVSVDQVEGLVHGAMFTRGPKDLKHTALFFGGSDVAKTESLVDAAKKCFFGPMRVSILADPNGSNTTAAAAVICAQRHGDLAGKTITILAGTGPVGQRIAQIIAGVATTGSEPPTIRVCSRKTAKAETICSTLSRDNPNANFVAMQTGTPEEAMAAVQSCDFLFAAGAAGIELLPKAWLESDNKPSVAVDLNAVPPAGIAEIGVMDSGKEIAGTVCYGAIGVGGLKMKIHKRALQLLFEVNDQVYEVEAIYELGRTIDG